MQQARKLFILFFIAVVLIIAALLYLMNLLKPSTSTPLPISPTQKPRGGSRFPEISSPISPSGIIQQPGGNIIDRDLQTGFMPTQLSDEEKQQITQRSNLQLNIPIETTAFTINYDYKFLKFVVVLRPDYTFNRQLFNQWKIDNNYSLIPEEEFTFVEN